MVSATVLSYFGDMDDVAELLQLLSHVTRGYFVKHADNLQPFLVRRPLPVTNKLPFIGMKEVF